MMGRGKEGGFQLQLHVLRLDGSFYFILVRFPQARLGVILVIIAD